MRRVDVVDGQKHCPRCDTTKPVDDFYRSKRYTSGYRSHCKACCLAVNTEIAQRDLSKGRVRSKRWYEKNPEHAQALSRRKHENRTEAQKAARRERDGAWKTVWRNAHRDESREAVRKATKAWRERHPDRAAASYKLSAQNRRAAKRGEPGITAGQWIGVVEVFGGVCAYCRRERKVGIDHFVPLARGGRHAISNAVPACRSCNSSKRHSDPFEWMESRGIDADLVVSLLCQTRHVMDVAAERKVS